MSTLNLVILLISISVVACITAILLEPIKAGTYTAYKNAKRTRSILRYSLVLFIGVLTTVKFIL
jgi:hypothetical protein